MIECSIVKKNIAKKFAVKSFLFSMIAASLHVRNTE